MKSAKDFQTPLPKVNPHEDLETISRNRFALLFDPALFELRLENQRDKGIDYIIELKYNDSYTNFRFAVQLKSTKVPRAKQDGTVTFPIDVSNIHYLLNFPVPSYYFLLDHTTGIFYLRNVFDVYQSMVNKYGRHEFPETYTVAFLEKVSSKSLNDLYDQSLATGNLLRAINPHIGSMDQQSKAPLLIDNKKRVFNIQENIEILTNHGLELLSAAAFNDIIRIEQHSHPRDEVSPHFNLVCGLAYFYKGQIYRALDFLYKADKSKDGFDGEAQTVLAHTLLRAKYEIGALDEEDFRSQTRRILSETDIGPYFEIERAYNVFWEQQEAGLDRLNDFYQTMRTVLKKYGSNQQTTALAYARILEIEYQLLLSDLQTNLFTATCNGTTTHFDRVLEEFRQLEEVFISRLDKMISYLSGNKNQQALANMGLIRVGLDYKKTYVISFFSGWDFKTLRSSHNLTVEEVKMLKKGCSFLKETGNIFQSMHSEVIN